MRNMSFALTTAQVRRREKTVTRRLGWAFATPGEFVQPIVKGQGIPKGGTVERIGSPVRIVSVTQERLDAITVGDVAREGFPMMTPAEFVEMFCRHNNCKSWSIVTRIVFEYSSRERFACPCGERRREEFRTSEPHRCKACRRAYNHKRKNELRTA